MFLISENMPANVKLSNTLSNSLAKPFASPLWKNKKLFEGLWQLQLLQFFHPVSFQSLHPVYLNMSSFHIACTNEDIKFQQHYQRKSYPNSSSICSYLSIFSRLFFRNVIKVSVLSHRKRINGIAVFLYRLEIMKPKKFSCELKPY